MDPSYNAIFKLFHMKRRDGATEDKKSTKSRAQKIFRSFKRTLKQGSSRYRDNKLPHFDTCIVDMQSDALAASDNIPQENPPTLPPRLGCAHMEVHPHQPAESDNTSQENASNPPAQLRCSCREVHSYVLAESDNNIPSPRPPSQLQCSCVKIESDASEEAPPSLPPRPRCSDTQNQSEDVTDKTISLGKEHFNLSKYGWYWGPMTKREAEDRLENETDGAFLVRDSTSNNHIYTLSLCSYGHIMHTHIEYYNGTYSLGTCLSRASVSELVASAMTLSESSILSYVESNNLGATVPIRLVKPISRNMQMRSLAHLARFVIRQHCNVNAIEELPLPTTLKQYLLQGQY